MYQKHSRVEPVDDLGIGDAFPTDVDVIAAIGIVFYR